MPGLSFICDLKCNLKQKESRILQSLKSMLHTEQYESKILLKEESYFLGYTGYKEYPVTSFENEEFCIYLEGQIYGKDYSTINSELNNLAAYIFHNRNDFKEQVAEWLLNTDGEFIVFIFHKNSMRICMVNDAMRRLPVYYYKNTDGKLVISRELRFVADLIDATSFDRMAIAQYLLFGYPLGKRTLWENILYLQPATLIMINLNRPEIKFDVLHQFNFESKKYNNRTIKQNATELVSLFCEACKNRAKQSKINVLALSGGFDSRSVAAGLLKTETRFQAVTRLDLNKEKALDPAIAEQLARELNLDWKLFESEPTCGRSILLRLLRIKNGLNYLGMGFILLFFDKLKETYGSNITYFTGDGGDRVKPHIKPLKMLKNIDKLINHILSHNQIFSLDDVVSITKIPRTKIIDELRNHVLSYPEREWNDKYIHFMVYESAFKWVFEGEDRNRYFFWSTTPFYSVKFFDYAMNIPDRMKHRYKLYGEFLTQLSPQASGIRTTHGNTPIGSMKARLHSFAMDYYLRLPPNLQRIVREIIKKRQVSEHNQNLIRCLNEQIKNDKSLSEYLWLDDIIQNHENYSKDAIWNLFTITSTIEEFSCLASTIEKFYGADFITMSV